MNQMNALRRRPWTTLALAVSAVALSVTSGLTERTSDTGRGSHMAFATGWGWDRAVLASPPVTVGFEEAIAASSALRLAASETGSPGPGVTSARGGVPSDDGDEAAMAVAGGPVRMRSPPR